MCVCATEGVYQGISAGVGVSVHVRSAVGENNVSTGNTRPLKDKEMDVASKM